MQTWTVKSGGHLQGELSVPGDKSVSHRALMLGALAEGVTEIKNFLMGADTLATLRALQQLGVAIQLFPEEKKVIVQGVGLRGLQPSKNPLDFENSGTSMRLMSGILAAQSFNSILVGDESLSKRPMLRVVEPLRQMGAHITTTANGTAPLYIQGQSSLQGIHYDTQIASAQVKSCLLLAGLYAQGETVISEPVLTRDHTERMLKAFGYPLERDKLSIRIKSNAKLIATKIDVPSDISSAAFFMVGASIATGSHLILKKVGVNPTRIGIIHLLRAMGADIRLFNETVVGDEPVADIQIRAATLHGIEIPREQVSLAIDEFPILFIAAACAKGKTILRHAKELRVKESDRIAVMAQGLQRLGIAAEPLDDGMIIEGGQLQGGVVDSHGDHRIAMAFAVAALRASSMITVKDCVHVATSFPNFVELARQAGLVIF